MRKNSFIITAILWGCLILLFCPQAIYAGMVNVGTCECKGKVAGALVDEPACTNCDGFIIGLTLTPEQKEACIKFVKASCTWGAPDCNCLFIQKDVKEAECNPSILPEIPGITVTATCTIKEVKAVDESTLPAGGTGTAASPSGGTPSTAPSSSGLVPAAVQPSSEDMINDAIKKIGDLTPKEMNQSDDLASIVGKAISLILGIIGSAALLVFLYSGIMWMTSGGVDKTIANAQKSMIWAAIGLFTVFFSYILVKYIITQAGA